MLETFGTGQGYLKAGFLGFPKSGKTYTAALLGCEVRKRFNLSEPIAIFDTEAGGEYVVPMIRKATGKPPVGKRSRSMSDLLSVARECEGGAASVLIVDSITHCWREVCEAYLKQMNDVRSAQGRPIRTRLEFPDWQNIKSRWAVWTDFYLNSRLHIIICGRAGYEWNFEEVDDSGKRELVKTGVKMKVESEFGFEPSLLVEMERVQVPSEGKDRFTFTHRARVLGDRFGVMDAAICDNPTGQFFAPHYDLLVSGASNVVDTSLKTDMGIDDSGDAKFQVEKRQKTTLLEEIQGEIVKAFPGQSAAEKKNKVVVLETIFGTKSWTAVEGLKVAELADGLNRLRQHLGGEQTTEEQAAEVFGGKE